MSSTVALFISLVYWIALHPYVVKYHMLGGAYAQFLNFFLHGFNSLSFLIDIFVTARPTRVHHFYFAIIFGKVDRLKLFEVTTLCRTLVHDLLSRLLGSRRCHISCQSTHKLTHLFLSRNGNVYHEVPLSQQHHHHHHSYHEHHHGNNSSKQLWWDCVWQGTLTQAFRELS